MSTPTYRLTYFNLTGRAEPIRFLLHHAGIKFEDTRINSEDWPKHKPDTPMGQLPVLEIDGRMYHQSMAICRYIARKNDLYGVDELEAFEIDMVVDTIQDLLQIVSMYYWEQDPGQKAKRKITAFQKVPYVLDRLEAQVKMNNGHFVRGKVSWADLVYAAYSSYLSTVLERDVNHDHPELKTLTEKILNLPRIKAYIETRPKTRI